MTNTNAVLTDSTGRSATATTNFLSSLTTSLGAGGGLSGLFESLLAAAQTATQQQGTTTASATAPTTTAIPSNSNNDPSTTNQAYASLSDIFAALHDFGAKWGIHHDGHKDNSGNSNDHPKQCASSAPAPTTTTSPASSSTTSSSTTTASTTTDSTSPTTPTTGASSTSDTSGTTTTTDTNVTTDPNAPAPASFADLLLQLQAILQMLQKQIQTAQNSTNGTSSSGSTTPATTDAGNTTANTQAIQDLLAAGGALADLLALAQKLEKKLGMSSTDGTTQTAGTNAAIDPNLTALDTQLRSNLQTLVGNLQAAASANASAASTDTTTVADTSTVAAADTSLLTASTTTTTGNTTATTPTTPNEIIKSALATADDFLKQLNSLYSSTNAPSFASVAAVNAAASANGGNGAGMDSDQDDTITAPTVSSSSATQAATPQVTTDNVKSTNPYSFASQLSATRAQNGGTVGLPTAVEQVLLLLNKNAKSGNDQMTLQLHPADLGSINVKLDFASDGTVSGTVVANNADTLAMLQKDSRSLERALQEAGLRADPGSLQFSLGGQSNSNNSAGTQNQSGGSTTSDTTASGLAALTPDSDFDTTDSWIITPNRVNIQV